MKKFDEDKNLKKNKDEEKPEENSAEAACDGSGERSGVSSIAGSLLFEKLARERKQTNSSQEVANWLTTREAAQYLRLSVGGIKMMVYRGQLRAHKLGKRNRFLREELDRQVKLPS